MIAFSFLAALLTYQYFLKNTFKREIEKAVPKGKG
jgi:hypothetical protein